MNGPFQTVNTFYFQRLIAELNKEQEAFIAGKSSEKGEAVAPWIGAPNEDALREECLALSTVSNFFISIIKFFLFNIVLRNEQEKLLQSSKFQ